MGEPTKATVTGYVCDCCEGLVPEVGRRPIMSKEMWVCVECFREWYDPKFSISPEDRVDPVKLGEHVRKYYGHKAVPMNCRKPAAQAKTKG